MVDFGFIMIMIMLIRGRLVERLYIFESDIHGPDSRSVLLVVTQSLKVG